MNDQAERSAVRPWVHAVRLLTTAALGISAYLLYGSMTGDRLAGCGPESGCDAVLRSRWAFLFGIPVTLPAVILYAAILMATFRVHSARAGRFLFLAAGSLIAAAVWFIGLQVFAIGSLCRFCMVAHGAGTLAALLILLGFRRPFGGPLNANFVALQPPVALKLALGGITPVLLMAAGQGLHEPKTFAVESADQLATRKAPRVVELHQGLFRIDLSETPLLGSLDASNIVVHLFDYTCTHCRKLHPMLKEAAQALSNQVAFASLVVPLATNCNHVMKRRIEQHAAACELAYACLAVWRARPGKLSELEEWIFSTATPPAPELVAARARQLVGTNEFDLRLKDPWIKEHLVRNIDLYATNYYRLRKATLPELMIGTNLVSGGLKDTQELYRLLNQQFSLERSTGVVK